jgi:hypothetical protein
MLHDDSRISHKRPKFIWLQPRVTLQVIEKGLLVCVVIGDCENISYELHQHGCSLTRLLEPEQLLVVAF